MKPITRPTLAIFLILALPPIALANFSMESTPPTTAWAYRSAGAYPAAIGYGSDVPLAFALRQIVPKGVLVVLGPGVTPYAIVSWRGGRPWNKALAHALAPAGLAATITPVLVKISIRSR